MNKLILTLALLAVATPSHAQPATWTSCQSTLLACSDQNPNCNTVTCEKWAMNADGTSHTERLPLTPKSHHDSKLTKVLLYGSWAACQSFDVISTAVALRNPNIIEGNPILRGPQLYPLKIGVNIGFGFWQHAIVRQQPTSKHRLTFPLVAASTGCLAGMLNTRTIRSLR